MTGGRQAPRLFWFFSFTFLQRLLCRGRGLRARFGSWQRGHQAAQGPPSSGALLARASPRLHKLLLKMQSSLLLFPAWPGIGLENQRSPSVSDGRQCSQPPAPSLEPLCPGGHTQLDPGRGLTEMGFEGTGGLSGPRQRKCRSLCSAREPGGDGAPLTGLLGPVFCGTRTRAHAWHFTRIC